MKKDHYNTLDVEEDATTEEIKTAYKDKAKKTHPDTKNGDEDKFKKVGTAYMVLSDPLRRDRYDKTGEDKQTPFMDKFMAFMSSVISQNVERMDIKTMNLAEMFAEVAEKNVALCQDNLNKAVRGINKLQEVKRRFSYDGDEENLIDRLMDGKIKDEEKAVLIIKEEMKFMEKALDILTHYDYKVDEMEPQDFITSRPSAGTATISFGR